MAAIGSRQLCEWPGGRRHPGAHAPVRTWVHQTVLAR
jgi:hypothetical protein